MKHEKPAGKIAVGAVVAAAAFGNSALVNVPGRGRYNCLYYPEGSATGLGVRTTSSLQPGDQVVALIDIQSLPGVGVVLAVVPPLLGTTDIYSDKAEQGGGQVADRAPQHAIMLKNTETPVAPVGGLSDLVHGEWAKSTEFGVALIIQRMAVAMRVNEMCGVWANWWDQSLRIAGRVLREETWASARRADLVDGRPADIRYQAVDPAEAVGLPADGSWSVPPGFRQETDDQDDTTGASEALDGQVLLPRLMQVRGWPGGILSDYGVLPVDGLSRYTTEVVRMHGVWRQHVGLDGSYLLESTQGLHLKKVPRIFVPHEIQQAETYGTGDAPPAFDWSSTSPAGFASLALEHHAWLTNVGAYRQVLNHGRWLVPEADTTRWTDTEMVDAQSFWRQPPRYRDFQPHPALGQQRTYEAAAGMDIMPDGSVVITDGWGSQIIMTGGNIFATCAGDIHQMPGRNHVTWAGGSINQRARDDIDLSSTAGSIRAKTERNFMALGGNGGEGGVLLESRGTSSTVGGAGAQTVVDGVVIRSQSDVAFRAANRLAVYSSDLVADVAGDALLSVAQTFRVYGASQVFDAGDTRYALTENGAVFGGSLQISGQLVANDDAVLGGNLLLPAGSLLLRGDLQVTGSVAAGGNMVAAGAVAAQSGVGEANVEKPLKGFRWPDADNQLATSRAQVSALGQVDETIEQLFTSLAELSFSFRLDAEYTGVAGFQLPAFAWQASIGDDHQWAEPAVIHVDGSFTAPYPGYLQLTETGEQLIVPAANLLPDGAYAPRNSADEGPETNVVGLSAYRLPGESYYG